ncbi:MAG: guanylate kinase [Gemmatimonadota bacterium]
MTRRAAPLVLAATSGTGKTTLARRLVGDSDRFVFSISATTRPPRLGEENGVDYHFLSEEDFERRAEAGDFAEWARVHGRSYGTLRSAIDGAADGGQHVVLDIDVQGARQIGEAIPDATLVFVLPPSVSTMMARLSGRGTERRAEVARRLRSAIDELQAVPEFDYVVVNDDLEACLDEIRRIVENGVGPTGPSPDASAFRDEIGRILDSEYHDELNEQSQR